MKCNHKVLNKTKSPLQKKVKKGKFDSPVFGMKKNVLNFRQNLSWFSSMPKTNSPLLYMKSERVKNALSKIREKNLTVRPKASLNFNPNPSGNGIWWPENSESNKENEANSINIDKNEIDVPVQKAKITRK